MRLTEDFLGNRKIGGICELKIGGRRESQICVTFSSPRPYRSQRNLCKSAKSVGLSSKTEQGASVSIPCVIRRARMFRFSRRNPMNIRIIRRICNSLTLPRCGVAGNGGVADEGDEEGEGHALRGVGYVTHQHGGYGATYYRHDEEGGG